jgi:DNA-binding transcriptional ArsR family regulator
MRGPEHVDQVYPTREEMQLVDVLNALSDPVRLQIVRELDRSQRVLICGDFNLPVVKSTRSHHFKVLREAGVIETWVEGTRRYNKLRREDLDARFPGLLDAVVRPTDKEPVTR